jgi:hypothetical protein
VTTACGSAAGRRRACRAAGVLEGEGAGEARGLDDAQGVLEVGVGLAGEADDDVGGDGGVGQAARTRSRMPEEALAAVAAAHRLEHRVGARLQRHVQAGADRGVSAMAAMTSSVKSRGWGS